MSVLPKFKGIVRSGSLIQFTKVPEDETELKVGSVVQVAGIDDAGLVQVVMDRGYGDWRAFDFEMGYEWEEV